MTMSANPAPAMDDFQAAYQNAQQWAMKGYFGEAIALYGRSIEMNPSFAEGFFERAMCRERISDYDGAISDYRRYLELGGGMRFGNQTSVEAALAHLDGLRRSGVAFKPEPSIVPPIKFPAGRNWW